MRKIGIFIIIVLVIIGAIVWFREPIMKKIYVIKYEEFVEKYATEYSVDKFLIYATIKVESNFEENATSSKGAQGLMQIMNSTAQDIAKNLGMELKEEDILEPEINIKLGTNYLSSLIKKYNNIELALAAYNAGGGNVDSWLENGTLNEDGSNIENVPYKETNNYVRKILRDYDIYKELYQ